MWRPQWFLRPDEAYPSKPEQARVWEAYAELQAVDRYFQEVTDPGLIDHAAYLLQAAEQKYRHCLQQAREWGV